MNFENEESCKRNKNYSNNKFSIETVSKKDVLNLSFMIFFNNCIRSSSSLEILKKAKVTQAFKKVDRSKYSTKKLIYLQLNNYMQKKQKRNTTRIT